MPALWHWQLVSIPIVVSIFNNNVCSCFWNHKISYCAFVWVFCFLFYWCLRMWEVWGRSNICEYLTTVKHYTLSEWCFKKLKHVRYHSCETQCRKFQSLDWSVIVGMQYMKHRTYVQVDVKILVKRINRARSRTSWLQARTIVTVWWHPYQTDAKELIKKTWRFHSLELLCSQME